LKWKTPGLGRAFIPYFYDSNFGVLVRQIGAAISSLFAVSCGGLEDFIVWSVAECVFNPWNALKVGSMLA
jgi:hypothetical protein